MKNFFSNSLNVYLIIILIVSICAALIQIIPPLVEITSTTEIEDFLDDKICCECGKKATEHVGTVIFYCDYCYDKKYGDVPFVEVFP